MSLLYIKKSNPLLVINVAAFSQFLISPLLVILFSHANVLNIYVVKSTIYFFMIETIDIVFRKLFICPKIM